MIKKSEIGMEKSRLGNIVVSPIGMGCMGLSHGYGDIPSEEYSIEAIRKAYDFGCTFFDTAEAYGPSMLRENRGHNERIVGKALKDVRQKVVIASGFLSGKVTVQTDFSHSDDVRKYVPQLRKENIDANQPVLDLLEQYASQKQATKAQVSLAWMLHKYEGVNSSRTDD